ncbi:hypothetical protein PsalMR5_01058 [Piscirickettsia salmonis]|nr:hypothetical protein PsalSR1_01057 [Piscirickettsia salmonis]QGP63211.1 hypothetical protein PsalMR5_01058 [Piscirickettsia salmonis]
MALRLVKIFRHSLRLLQTYGLLQLRSAKNPHLPRPTHPVLSTPWLAAIDQNSGKTHQQLADLYPVEMSAKTMGVWIKKLGYTRKKRASDTKNVMH